MLGVYSISSSKDDYSGVIGLSLSKIYGSSIGFIDMLKQYNLIE